MDYPLFCSVLRNLLHLNVHAGPLDNAYLRSFEDKYCYHAALQPLFRAETLGPLIGTILTLRQQNRFIDYRMGQVEDREATPEEENMFAMASLM